MMRFLYTLAAIGKALAVTQTTQRKIELQEQQKILNAARIACENNAVVLLDIEIDRRMARLRAELIELEKLQRQNGNASYDLDRERR